VVKLFYELGYRHWRMPWEGGPRSELVELVRTGRLEPCRALDLRCGSGANAVFLAEHGFDTTMRLVTMLAVRSSSRQTTPFSVSGSGYPVASTMNTSRAV
jgi:Tellurite resistance protein TehB